MDVVWLMGRGVSASCGFSWLPRPHARAQAIRGELRKAQHRALAQGDIDLGCLDRLLAALRAHPARHTFVTTNWNTVLDSALRRHGYPPAVHLNGSIADGGDLLKAQERQDARRAPLETHPGFRRLAAAESGVLAGLSLQGRLDHELLERVGRAHRRPAASRWIVVNADAGQVRAACALLQRCLPGAAVLPVARPLAAWVDAGMPELAGVTSA